MYFASIVPVHVTTIQSFPSRSSHLDLCCTTEGTPNDQTRRASANQYINIGVATLATLPKKDHIIKGDVIVSGWGVESYSEGMPVYANILRTAELPTKITDPVCKKFYKNMETHMQCIGTVPHPEAQGSAAQFDEGGPVVEKSTKTLVGLIADVGSLDVANPRPNLITEVAAFVDWIEKTIKDNTP